MEGEQGGEGERGRQQQEGVVVNERVEEDAGCGVVLDCLLHFSATGSTEGLLDQILGPTRSSAVAGLHSIAAASRLLVDALPKGWGSGRGGGSSDVSRGEESSLGGREGGLAGKKKRHEQLLQMLHSSGLKAAMLSAAAAEDEEAHCVALLLSHGEKLSFLGQLRDDLSAANSQQQQQQQQQEKQQQQQAAFSAGLTRLLMSCIERAGSRLKEDMPMAAALPTTDLFFSRPSQIEHFFVSIQQQLQPSLQPLPFALRLQQLLLLAAVLQRGLQAASLFVDHHQGWYEGGRGTGWQCSGEVLAALWDVAQEMMRMRDEVRDLLPADLSSLEASLLSMAALLLGLSSRQLRERQEEEATEAAAVFEERRDELFHFLLKCAKEAAAAMPPEHEAAEFHRRLSALIPLAKQHAAYSFLLSSCQLLQQPQQLVTLMSELQSSPQFLDGSFCFFVFRHLLHSHQFPRLLRFGQIFPHQLSSFLQVEGHEQLASLFKMNQGQFSSAAQLLLSLSFSPSAAHSLSSTSAISHGLGAEQEAAEVEAAGDIMRRRKRLLLLSKLCTLAASKRSNSEGISSINLHLSLFRIQEAAMGQGLVGPEWVSGTELASACSRGGRDMVRAGFQVVSLLTAGSREQSGADLQELASVLSDLWLAAMGADDWLKMKAKSEEDAWGDEQVAEALQGTLLFEAAKALYGTGVGGGEGWFAKAFPLLLCDRAQDLWQSRERFLSVEEILQQHEFYEHVGEALVITLQMGRGR